MTGPGINFHEVCLITHTLSYSFIKALKMNPGMVTLTLTDELRPEYRGMCGSGGIGRDGVAMGCS